MKLAPLVCALLCTFAASVAAAPKHPRSTKLDPALSAHVRAAELAWTAADHENSAALQPAAWEAAARAFAEVDGDAVDAHVKTEAARAAVLAWENALDAERPVTKVESSNRDSQPQPRPVPEREKAMIAAFERFRTYVTDPADPDLPVVLFVEARTYSRFDQLEPAIKLYRALLDHHRKHEVAEYAANLLLDTYNRLARYDELIALARELAKDTAFLDGKDDLKALVMRIDRTAHWREIEAKERAARESHDPDKYDELGRYYMDLYNADPKARDGDEALYNAGVMFEEGRAVAAALQAFSVLAKQYPNSKLTAKALARTGRLYGDIAMYDKAADKLEEYAKRYAGEKDARDALSDAVYYRRSIGDRDKTIADVNYYVKTFGAKAPHEAADAVWSLTPFYESDPPRLLAHLQGYLRTFGSKGGLERTVIAHARIGQVLWKQSCPVPGFDGLCVKSNENAPRSCGTATVHTFTAVPRDAAKAKQALAEFANARLEFERARSEDLSARYYYAQAKLAATDADLERYLTLAFPKLDFDLDDRPKREASMKRFNGWMSEKTRSGSTANRGYEEVLAIKDVATSITAAERMGIIVHAFATTLVTAPPPADLKRQPSPADALAAYCSALETAAEPLDVQTLNAYATCLAKSVELAWFDDSSRVCERELERIKPDEFPAATERRARATSTSPVIALEPPIR